MYDDESTTATRHYLLSTKPGAARLAQIVRAHWHIETRLRRSALNVLRANKDKGSTRGRIERAAWDDAFLNLLACA